MKEFETNCKGGLNQPVLGRFENTIVHCPENCDVCGAVINISRESEPYLKFQTMDVTKENSGFRIMYTNHCYYSGLCKCGNETKAHPEIEKFPCILKNQKDEDIYIGPKLTAFFASLD